MKENNNPEIQETFRFPHSPASKQPLLLQVNDDAGEDDGRDGDDNGDINNNSFSIARKKENFCHNASLEHTLTPGRKDPVWSILIKQSMTVVDI